jgi:hypothetical protein
MGTENCVDHQARPGSLRDKMVADAVPGEKRNPSGPRFRSSRHVERAFCHRLRRAVTEENA